LWVWAILIPVLLIDSLFVVAVLDDVLSGGWFTIAMCLLIMVMLFTWHKGKVELDRTTRERAIALKDMVEIVRDFPPTLLPGTAIFLSRFTDYAPFALVNNIKAHRVLHERTILLESQISDTPRVDDSRRLCVSEFAPGFWMVQVTFGFMEKLDVPNALRLLPQHGLLIDLKDVSYYVGRRSSVAGSKSRMPAWQHGLFAFMQRNSARPSDFYHLPHEQVVEVIVRYPI
jgi:KUP system potassium uptake protein